MFFLLVLLLVQAPSRKAETGTITGVILRTNGVPATGVRVAVTPLPDPKNPAATGDLISIAQTDEKGHYQLENIPPGKYYIQAGLLELPNYFPGVTALDKATVITVSAGEV